jgi:hypothetical protein
MVYTDPPKSWTPATTHRCADDSTRTAALTDPSQGSQLFVKLSNQMVAEWVAVWMSASDEPLDRSYEEA